MEESASALRKVMTAGGLLARQFTAAQLMTFMTSERAVRAGYELRSSVPRALMICAAPIAAYVGRLFDRDVVHMLTSLYTASTADVGDAAHLTWVRYHYAPCKSFMNSVFAPPPPSALWTGYWAAGVECRRQIAIMSWQAREPSASQEPITRLRMFMESVWPMYRDFTANIVRAEAQHRLDALVAFRPMAY